MHNSTVNRMSPNGTKPKKGVSLSFAGDRGYRAFEILEENRNVVNTGKSGLMIELLIAYGKYVEKYGKEGALMHLSNIEE